MGGAVQASVGCAPQPDPVGRRAGLEQSGKGEGLAKSHFLFSGVCMGNVCPYRRVYTPLQCPLFCPLVPCQPHLLLTISYRKALTHPIFSRSLTSQEVSRYFQLDGMTTSRHGQNEMWQLSPQCPSFPLFLHPRLTLDCSQVPTARR